jgi:DNA-binding helix-hairpin-helix protein with protein kinase domain
MQLAAFLVTASSKQNQERFDKFFPSKSVIDKLFPRRTAALLQFVGRAFMQIDQRGVLGIFLVEQHQSAMREDETAVALERVTQRHLRLLIFAEMRERQTKN